ncbi:MAG: phosphate ABC transporter permease subunit PstC [Chloroflexia bacterium]
MAVRMTARGGGREGAARNIDLRGGSGGAMGDRVFQGIAFTFAATILVLLATIFIILLIDARTALVRQGLRFITGQVWNPTADVYGALPYIYGTLVTSLLGLLIATPIAVGAALFIVEYAPAWLRTPVSFVVELLAVIPSVIYGFWGIAILAPFLRDRIERPVKAALTDVPVLNHLVAGPARGRDMFVAGVILSIMILPTIMSVAREVISTVPGTQREGMLALGATKWEMIRGAVLPYARTGIVGAAMLGLGRAIGETMAVTMLIGNSSTKISWSILTPGYTMASAIANQFADANSSLHFSAIIGVAVVLLFVTGMVNLTARVIVGRFGGDTRATGL